ncbi:MAG: DUF2017 family protein [Acidimicrobiia bacterium]|nr:DUF2017 family protein [Acidimicrobiia bacterium]
MARDGGFGLFDNRWVRPDREGGFDLAIPSGVRTMLGDLVDRLDELLGTDSDLVRRVFPTAYPDDAEREAGYQAMVRGELIDRHRASAATIADTVEADHLTEAELTAWMTAVNALRLVFGTALDVSEDVPLHVDMDSDEGPAQLAYQVLSELVDDIVTALRWTLPEPEA